ncbi:MAG: aspartate-semialdehyde dehydrogenase family protein [Candidatus Hadarchaeales archaeon]
MQIKVGILGATGEVGQRFVLNLQRHPWFKIAALYASEKSAGKTYREALSYGKEDSRWFCREKPLEEVLEMEVKSMEKIDAGECSLFFSALPSEVALEVEGRVAREKPVVSTASAYRYFDDSFTYLPGVNEDHVQMIEVQRRNRGWRGFVVPQPNCTTIGLALSLKPIYEKFGLRSVVMASMQSVSGAGYAAVAEWAKQRKAQGSELPYPLENYSLKMFEGNVIPYIKDEEMKVKRETVKLLGKMVGERIEPARFLITCKCNRVPVLYGHTESVFIQTEKKCTLVELKEAWRNYMGLPQKLGLPTAPKHPIVVMEEVDRPQPRFDSNIENGMVAVIGGVEETPFENGFQYTVLSHNIELGAARGAVLAAEYLYKAGLIS